MLNKFLSKITFESYKDFVQNFQIRIPDNFNFAYDVVDELARQKPDKTAIVWCDDNGGEAVYLCPAEILQR